MKKRYERLSIPEMLTLPKPGPSAEAGRRCDACRRVYPDVCHGMCPADMRGLCTDCAVLQYRLGRLTDEDLIEVARSFMVAIFGDPGA